ncbi:hypothetical protein Ndes2437B_g02835 [Nannochloris sp. 'desiccata']
MPNAVFSHGTHIDSSKEHISWIEALERREREVGPGHSLETQSCVTMSSPPRDSSSVPIMTEEEEQLLANPATDVGEQQPFLTEKVVSKTEEEEAEFSDHSDSWEVISRTSPRTTAKEAKEPEEKENLHQSIAQDTGDAQQQVAEEENQDQATEAAAVSKEEEKEEHHEEEEEFTYTSTPEEIHSDADTYRTDDLFRQGELEYYDPTASPSSPPAEGENPGVEGKYASSPQKSSSCTPTEDDDFIKLATAIMHQHQHGATTVEDFDNAEELALKKYIVAPATATAAALVGAAQAVINSSTHCVVNFADRLRFFAAKFRAYVTNLQPTAHRLAGTMSSTVQQMARSLHFKAGPGVRALCIPLNGAGVLASDVVNAVRHVVCTAATRARKGADGLSFKDLDWVKIGLAVATVGCAGMLWRVNAANARLTCRLTQREGELAELVARIVALQRNITSHRVPIIRHTTASTFSTTVGWPLLVQAI